MPYAVLDRPFFQVHAHDIPCRIEPLRCNLRVVGDVPNERNRPTPRIQRTNTGVGAGDPLINDAGLDLAQFAVQRPRIHDISHARHRPPFSDSGYLVMADSGALVDEMREVVNLVLIGGKQRVDQQTNLIFGTAPMFKWVDDANLGFLAAQHRPSTISSMRLSTVSAMTP